MNDLYPLVGPPASQSQRRGKLLEGILKRLFKAGEISVRDAFEVVDEEGEGIIEPINGVVDREGNPYLGIVKKILSKFAEIWRVCTQNVRLSAGSGVGAAQ